MTKGIGRHLLHIAVLALLLVAVACSGGTSASLSCSGDNMDGAKVLCADAAQTAQSIATSHDVHTGSRTYVSLGSWAVAQGTFHPSWIVTWDKVEYRPPSGDSCTPRSYQVVVDALTGDVLAFDNPAPDCSG